MQQPQGFVIEGSETKVCLLKQSSKLWNQKLNGILTDLGFTVSAADPCVYIRRSKNEFTLLGLWVNDGLLCSNNISVINEILHKLSFPNQPLTVGLLIPRDREKRQLFLSQLQYIKDMLHRFNMAGCHPRKAPADPQSHPTASMLPEDDEGKKRMASRPYRELIGSLSYAANCTRPDISYVVNQLALVLQ